MTFAPLSQGLRRDSFVAKVPGSCPVLTSGNTTSPYCRAVIGKLTHPQLDIRIMKDLNESVVESLDGFQTELLPYLPYLLQDLWEIGADPNTMLSLIKQYIRLDKLNILDLGCGKGAVSIKIAQEINCTILGIDALLEFIESARDYAKKYNVGNICKFEVGDIRVRIKELSNFDIIILGAIGPVLGDLETTLTTLAKSLISEGYVLLDDGYIDDNSKTKYDRCLRRTEFYKQIKEAGFEIIHEEIFAKDMLEDSDIYIFDSIKRRANELIDKLPDKKEVLEGYLKSQEFENRMLENEIITGTWLLKKYCA
jgi:SAM-dependent methyltransferase